MANRDELLALAARVEAATEPSIPLDEAIGAALGLKPQAWVFSLDVALSLVPEGWGWKMESGLGHGTECIVGHVGANKMYDRPEQWAKAATPALALCAAALRARAATTVDDLEKSRG